MRTIQTCFLLISLFFLLTSSTFGYKQILPDGGWGIYEVQPGDNLSSLANSFILPSDVSEKDFLKSIQEIRKIRGGSGVLILEEKIIVLYAYPFRIWNQMNPDEKNKQNLNELLSPPVVQIDTVNLEDTSRMKRILTKIDAIDPAVGGLYSHYKRVERILDSMEENWGFIGIGFGVVLVLVLFFIWLILRKLNLILVAIKQNEEETGISKIQPTQTVTALLIHQPWIE